MADNRYMYQTDDSDLAAIRLDRLERFLDPATFRGLDRVGVPRGGRSLEIGAGRGSAVLHMLARCGRGEVIATDLDTTLIDQLAHPCLRVIHHNILDDDLEPLGTFDLVHVRFVINHLGKRGGEAIHRAASLLNPGGTLFIEEPAAVNRAGRLHPDGELFVEWHDGLRQFSTEFGIDLDCGFSLPGMLRDAGLVDVDNELSGTVTHGGDPYREWWRASYELTKQTVPFDEIFGGRTSEFLTLNDDPFLDHIGWMVVGAWGMKPPV